MSEQTTGFVDHADAALIGNLVVQTSTLERLALVSFGRLLPVPLATTNAVFGGEQASWVFDKLKILATLRLADRDDLCQRWLAWVSSAKAITERRNRIVHSLWAHDTETAQMVGSRLRRNRPSETVEFDRSAVAALIAEAGRLLMVCVMLQVDTQRRVGAQITEGLADSLADELRTSGGQPPASSRP
jgi:hypothetical protein